MTGLAWNLVFALILAHLVASFCWEQEGMNWLVTACGYIQDPRNSINEYKLCA